MAGWSTAQHKPANVTTFKLLVLIVIRDLLTADVSFHLGEGLAAGMVCLEGGGRSSSRTIAWRNRLLNHFVKDVSEIMSEACQHQLMR